jgi:hypothetical protein
VGGLKSRLTMHRDIIPVARLMNSLIISPVGLKWNVTMLHSVFGGACEVALSKPDRTASRNNT